MKPWNLWGNVLVSTSRKQMTTCWKLN